MDTLKLKTGLKKATGINFIIGCMLASTLSLAPLSAAFADRDDEGGRGGGWRGGEHEGGWRGGDRDGGWRGGDRDRDEWRRREAYGNGYGGYGAYQQPVYPQAYGYAQPVYVPPPVRYLPPQSPGINLVVPLNFR